MELFSELYNCYYSVVSKILQQAPISEKQILELIRSNAFSESELYLIPKLCKEDGWGLFEKSNHIYSSILQNTPNLPVTLLEKRWLKSLLMDPLIRLFLDEDCMKELEKHLSDIDPLYHNEHFKWFDMFTDGDDYTDVDYIHNFRMIKDAIRSKSILTITFKSGKGNHIAGSFLPYRLEYSQKNDRFRVFVAKVADGNLVQYHTVNLSRILSLKITEFCYPVFIDMEQIFLKKRCVEPVTLRISSERNGIERFLMEFASYEKHTIIEEETGTCTATLWYDLQDETELLIKLLSFGPVLKVTGPPRMLEQMKDRVNQQYQLFYPNNPNSN